MRNEFAPKFDLAGKVALVTGASRGREAAAGGLQWSNLVSGFLIHWRRANGPCSPSVFRRTAIHGGLFAPAPELLAAANLHS
ncbi:MAG: hypothetical protein E5W70_22945 [Mesorhizobium sp.]|nr:MAG: hypothetical protein E5W70_22945 [Mesorhizobium sp.]